MSKSFRHLNNQFWLIENRNIHINCRIDFASNTQMYRPTHFYASVSKPEQVFFTVEEFWGCKHLLALLPCREVMICYVVEGWIIISANFVSLGVTVGRMFGLMWSGGSPRIWSSFLFVFVSTRMIDMSNGTHVKMLRVECAYDAHTVKMLKVW